MKSNYEKAAIYTSTTAVISYSISKVTEREHKAFQACIKKARHHQSRCRSRCHLHTLIRSKRPDDSEKQRERLAPPVSTALHKVSYSQLVGILCHSQNIRHEWVSWAEYNDTPLTQFRSFQRQFWLGPCESFFSVRIKSRIESAVRFVFESNLRIESAVYTTQAVTQPDGLQAYRTGL